MTADTLSIMNTQIQVFKHPVFGEIRTTQDSHGEPLFIASDMAKGLGYSSASALTRTLDDDEKGMQILHTLGGEQQLTVITEAGFYHAAMKSRVEKAKEFRRWVTHEVLPQIRKTGGYIPVKAEDDEKTILAKAVKILMKTVDMQKAMLDSQRKELAEQDTEIARLLPKAEYAEEVLLSPTCYTMTQVAKSLSMTVQQLQHQLHDLGIIYRSPSGPWMLYAPYLKQGYEAYRTKSGVNLFGETMWTDTYLVWTERGKEFIHKSLSPALPSA